MCKIIWFGIAAHKTHVLNHLICKDDMVEDQGRHGGVPAIFFKCKSSIE